MYQELYLIQRRIAHAESDTDVSDNLDTLTHLMYQPYHRQYLHPYQHFLDWQGVIDPDNIQDYINNDPKYEYVWNQNHSRWMKSTYNNYRPIDKDEAYELIDNFKNEVLKGGMYNYDDQN